VIMLFIYIYNLVSDYDVHLYLLPC